MKCVISTWCSSSQSSTFFSQDYHSGFKQLSGGQKLYWLSFSASWVPTNAVPTYVIYIYDCMVPTNAVVTNTISTNAFPTNAFFANTVPTKAIPTDVVHSNTIPTNKVHSYALTPFTLRSFPLCSN